MLNKTNTATTANHSNRFARKTISPVNYVLKKIYLLPKKEKKLVIEELSTKQENKKVLKRVNTIFSEGKIFCKKLSTGAYQIRWKDAINEKSALAYGPTLELAYNNLLDNYFIKYHDHGQHQ